MAKRSKGIRQTTRKREGNGSLKERMLQKREKRMKSKVLQKKEKNKK